MFMKRPKVTIYDIANALQVSPSTVSRAIADSHLISDEVKERIQSKAAEMGYEHPNLRLRKKGIVAIVVPEIKNFFYEQIIASIQQKLGSNYLISIFCSFDSPEIERSILSKFAPSHISCLIIAQAMNVSNSSHIKAVEKKGIPVVLFNRVDYDYECPKFLIDNYMDSYLLTNHLVGSNYRKIAFAAKHYSCPIYEERVQAYKDVLDSSGIEFNSDYLIYSELTNEDVVEVVQRFLFLKPRPDALILPGFTAALQAISITKKYGIDVPNDMAIVSFDEDPESKYSSPTITGIERPLQEIGAKIGETVMKICENKPMDKNTVKVFKSHLIVRGSSLRTTV